MIQSFIDWFDDKGFLIKPMDGTAGAVPMQLFPHQRRILQHCFTPIDDMRFPYSTIVYSSPKKSGKTAVGAAIMAWAGECFPPGSEIYSIANDIEQAQSRAFGDVDYHVTHQLDQRTTRYRVEYDNGTFIQAIAQHYSSAAGARQALSLFDELWAYVSERSRRMWAEMTPPPSIPYSMRVVVTYAGFENESEQLLDLYNMCFKRQNGRYVNGEVIPELADIVDSRGEPVCRRNGRTFIYWDHEPRMPWQTPEYYEEQFSTLRPSDFMRMHRNEWVSSTESFIPVELWDQASNKLQGPLTVVKGDKRSSMPITIGIDIGMKHDCSALVGTYYDSTRRKCGLAFHRIWTPPKDGSLLDLESTVEAELIKLWTEYNVISVVYDPAQFQRSAVSLTRKGIPLIEFTQTGQPMVFASQNLYDLLRSRNLEAYPDPELRDHIRYSSAEQTSRGFRLVKGKNMKFPIDAAIALAMAAYYSVNQGGADTTSPLTMILPFADASAVRIPTITDVFQQKLPEALRD